MAIDVTREIKEGKNKTIILSFIILIAVFVLAVWPGFLKKSPRIDVPSVVGAEKFRQLPKINWQLLKDEDTVKNLADLKVFQNIRPHDPSQVEIGRENPFLPY